MLLVDSVRPFSTLRLEGFNLVAGLLHRAGHEAADSVFLPAHGLHNLGQSGAILPLEHGDHLGGLGALAGTLSLRLRGFLGRFGGLLGSFGSLGLFLVALGLAGATRRACFAALAFVGAFGSWVSVFGAACASRVVVASFSIVFMAFAPWR